MEVFTTLFINLIPLYALIGLGWIAGRYFDVDRQSLGSLGIYIFMPVVAFGFVAKIELQPIYILLPVIIFALFSGLTLLFYQLTQKIYDDHRANLLAMCAAAGNTGYFGLPIVLLLFDPQWVGVYIFAMMGVAVYEATVMYYVANRGRFSVRQSLIKLLKFPSIYAIIAGLVVNMMHWELSTLFNTYWDYFKGAYVLIGMMIIGASLAKAKKLVIGPRFLSFTFFGKFIVWPAMAYSLILFDQGVTGWFEPEIHKMIFLMAIVPPAANIAAFAAQLDMSPEKAATTVLIGTLVALFYIPFILLLTGL